MTKKLLARFSEEERRADPLMRSATRLKSASAWVANVLPSYYGYAVWT